MATKSIYTILMPYLWSHQNFEYKKRVFAFLLFTFVSGISVLSVPIFLKYTILALEERYSFLGYSPSFILILYSVLWTVTKIIDRLRHQFCLSIVSTLVQKFIIDILDRLFKMPLSFYQEKESGQLSNMIGRSRMALSGLAQIFLQEILPTFLQLIMVTILLTFYFTSKYGLILFVMLFFYVIIMTKAPSVLFDLHKRQNYCDEKAHAFFVDSLLNTETVQYFNTSLLEREKAQSLLSLKQKSDQDSFFYDALAHLFQTTVLGLGVVLITFFSGMDVYYYHMDVGDFVMINSFFLMLMAPLSSLGSRYREALAQLAYLESACELLRYSNKESERPFLKDFIYCQGAVEFKNVVFSYENKKKIINNLSLVLEPKKTTAIVGLTGSGKTTLVKLLFKLHEPSSGDIFIDSQNIKSLSRGSLTQELGIVSQNIVLFNDTIAKNILYPLEDSPIDLKSVIEKAGLKSLISRLPKGIETVVGERGVKLSGGEKQRIAIARILVRSPKIIVFDEATSSLDAKTENQIQECLDLLSEGRTTLILGSRLSSIQHADMIMVLDEGCIVEQGTHQQLTNKKGKYYDLFYKNNQ